MYFLNWLSSLSSLHDRLLHHSSRFRSGTLIFPEFMRSFSNPLLIRHAHNKYSHQFCFFLLRLLSLYLTLTLPLLSVLAWQALQQTKVECTWDEVSSDRKALLSRVSQWRDAAEEDFEVKKKEKIYGTVADNNLQLWSQLHFRKKNYTCEFSPPIRKTGNCKRTLTLVGAHISETIEAGQNGPIVWRVFKERTPGILL